MELKYDRCMVRRSQMAVRSRKDESRPPSSKSGRIHKRTSLECPSKEVDEPTPRERNSLRRTDLSSTRATRTLDLGRGPQKRTGPFLCGWSDLHPTQVGSLWVGGHNRPPYRGPSSGWEGVGLAVGKGGLPGSHIIPHQAFKLSQRSQGSSAYMHCRVPVQMHQKAFSFSFSL